jgi:hypothetical protein
MKGKIMKMKNLMLRASLILVVLYSSASALVIDSEVTWTARTEINGLEGGFLEIVEGGHLIANARVDLNGSDVEGEGRLIINGGIFESNVDFKHPDNDTGMPCSIEINAGTFIANQIQSFGFQRQATIEIGGGTLIVQSHYNPDGGDWEWNPAEWILQGFLYAKDGYELVVEDLGGGAVKIYGSLLTTLAHNPKPFDEETGVLIDGARLSWSAGTDPNDPNSPNPNIKEHYLWLSEPYDLENPVVPERWWREPGARQFTIDADTAPADGNVDPNVVMNIPGLQKDSLYLWIVDEGLFGSSGPEEADPSKIIWGKVWSFETETTGAQADAGLNIVTWLDETTGKATVIPDASVTDPSGDLATILWSVESPPADPNITILDPTVENPTVEIVAVGTFTLKVVATDLAGNPPGEDTMEIRVFANSCEAAKNNPNGYDASRSDFNGDCVVDFLDFAMFVSEWADDKSLITEETYE